MEYRQKENEIEIVTADEEALELDVAEGCVSLPKSTLILTNRISGQRLGI